MKRISFCIILCLCLFLFAACANTENTPTDPPVQVTTAAPTEPVAETEPITEPATDPVTEPVTEPENGLDPMGLVGSWEFAYTEIEGEIVEDGSATIIISGDDVNSLTITLRDHLYPDESFTEKAMIFDEREMYVGCGNEEWVMDVDYVGDIGNTEYTVTLTAEDTLLIQYCFTIEDMPMVSYRWFTRSE